MAATDALPGVSVTLDVAGISEINARLNGLLARCEDLTPAMENIGASLLTSTQHRFERQIGPDGVKWKELSPATIIARLGGMRKAFTKSGRIRKPAARKLGTLAILRDSARLYQSLTYSASRTNVRVGSNVIYARIQQLGGMAGRGRKVKIPARPYLGVDGDDRQEIGAIVDDFLAGALR